MVYLSILFDILFVIVLGYLIYRFVEVLLKMKDRILFPITKEDVASVRQHPDKPLDMPLFADQKNGIFLYGGMLLFVLTFFILGLIFDVFSIPMYLVLILPFSYSQDVLNLFAITESGILSGVRFISWKKIKSYEFIPIGLNHRYYGFSKEANTGYELKLKTNCMPFSCVITSEETKIFLETFLNERLTADVS